MTENARALTDRRCDIAKCARVCDVGRRVGEVRMVQHIQPFKAELQPDVLSKHNRPEQAPFTKPGWAPPQSKATPPTTFRSNRRRSERDMRAETPLARLVRPRGSRDEAEVGVVDVAIRVFAG